MAINVSWEDPANSAWLDTTNVVWLDYDPHTRPENISGGIASGALRDSFRKPYLFQDMDDPYMKMMQTMMDGEVQKGGVSREKYLEFKKPYMCDYLEQLSSAQYQGKEGTGATRDIWKPYYPECESNVVTKLIGQRPPSRGLTKPGTPYLPGDVPEPTTIRGTAHILGETEVNIGDVDVYSPFGTVKPPITWWVIGGIIVNGFDPYRQYVEWTEEGIQVIGLTDAEGRQAGLAVDVTDVNLATGWTARTASADLLWQCVAWSPSLELFVAGAIGQVDEVMTSPDGIIWTSRDSGFNGAWQSVAWSPGLSLFAMVGTGFLRFIMTSSDGITWTKRTSPASSEWYGVTWSPGLGLFVAVGTHSSGGGDPVGEDRVATSSDGVTWTERDAALDKIWAAVVWSPELSLLVGVASNTSSVMTSSNGIDWTERAGPRSANWSSVAWSPELTLFVAVTGNLSYTITSPDGITWTERVAPSSSLRSIVWSPESGIFVAVASSQAFTSSDGITWTAQTAVAGQWESVAWSPSLETFVAVSDGGTNFIMTSP